jgi:hypothetical protein
MSTVPARYDLTIPQGATFRQRIRLPFDCSQVEVFAQVWNPPPNPARFDTYTQSDGTEWIYDQPRNPNGTYVSDDPETEQVESAMTWLLVTGDPP